MTMGTMRMLLERLTGRYRFTFKPARPVGAGSQGPDTLLVAQPTKLVRVELEYYAQPDRWHATIFDEDAPEDNPHGIVGGQAFAKGLTQDEAEEAAIEVTLKYLGQKGRAVREATGRGMRAMVEATVTFKVTPEGRTDTLALAIAEPRKEITAYLYRSPHREGTYEVDIADEEDRPNYDESESSFWRQFPAKSVQEAIRKATQLVQQYLKDHLPGWYQAELDARFKEKGRPDYDVPGRGY